MSITFFGVLWAFVLIVTFLLQDMKKMFTLLLLAFTLQSSAVIILNGTRGIGPQFFSIVAFLALAFVKGTLFRTGKLVWRRKMFVLRKRDMHSKVCIFTAVLFCVVLFASSKINSREQVVDNNWSMIFLQICIYVLCFVVMFKIKNITIESLHNSIMIVIIFVMVIGIWQFLTTINILPRIWVMDKLIYSDPSESLAYNQSYYPRLFSTFMEPSYAAPFLVASFYYLLATMKSTGKNMLIMLTLLLEIILTFSSTAYGAFFVTGIFYICFSKNKKALKWLLPIGIVMLAFMFMTGEAQRILNSVIFNKNSTGSYRVRMGAEYMARELFSAHPVLGLGLSVNVANSLFTTWLVQTGILGTVCILSAILPLLIYFFRNKNDYAKAVFLFSVGVLSAHIISVGYLVSTGFWMMLIICALAYNVIQSELLEEDK